jgi:hypothetical protein
MPLGDSLAVLPDTVLCGHVTTSVARVDATA